MNKIKFRGLDADGNWFTGSHLKTGTGSHYIVPQNMIGSLPQYPVRKDTVSQFVGLTDENEEEMFEGDIAELEVDGEIRHFVVRIKTVVREVMSHPSFDDSTAKVEITGVVFEWNGFDLFPCVDDKGVADNKRMVVVGNIYETPELVD